MVIWNRIWPESCFFFLERCMSVSDEELHHVMRVRLPYPGGHRSSRGAPACCSTWPRTHKSWWGWRPPSPRPASLRRHTACASCSVCRRRNNNEDSFTEVQNSEDLCLINWNMWMILQSTLGQGFILYVKIDGYSLAVGARMIIPTSTVNIYHHLTGWLANTCFLSDFRTYHSSKMFSARGPVSHRPHLTVPSVTLATPSGRADLDLLRPVSHSYGLK